MKKKLPLLLFLLILAALAFYFLTRKGQSNFAEKLPEQQVAQDILANCKYDQEFCSYMAAQAKAMANGVIITTSSQIKDAGLSTSEMRIDGKENMEISSFKDGKPESSMIVFEKVTYLKDLQDGTWYAMNTPNPQDNEYADQTAVAEIKDTYNEQNQNMQVKKIAREACGDLTCDKYEVIDGVGETTTKMYVFVDTKEHLARKMEFNFAGGSSVMEYKYETVQISKPTPIKELPSLANPQSGTNVDPKNNEMPSQAEIEQMMKDYSLDR